MSNASDVAIAAVQADQRIQNKLCDAEKRAGVTYATAIIQTIADGWVESILVIVQIPQTNSDGFIFSPEGKPILLGDSSCVFGGKALGAIVNLSLSNKVGTQPVVNSITPFDLPAPLDAQ